MNIIKLLLSAISMIAAGTTCSISDEYGLDQNIESITKLNVSFLVGPRDVKYLCFLGDIKDKIEVEESGIWWNRKKKR